MRYSWYHNAHPRIVPGCRQCRKHLASHRWAKNQERHIGDRFPRLLLAMQTAACLSRGETISCLRFYMRGDKWAGEAVNHFGGTRAVILGALRVRHGVQRYSRAGVAVQ